MGIIVNHVCDKCGHEQETGDQMWYLHVGISSESFAAQCTPSVKEYWCRECIQKLGLLMPHILNASKEEVEPPKFTLEELIREIVQDEMGML